MNLLSLIKKYKITDEHMDIIASSMMSDLDLTETMHKLAGIINQEQVFVIASAFCRSEYGEPLDNIAPMMVMERIQMNQSKSGETQLKINETKELKRLKAIEEDLLLYEAEQALKIAV